MRKTTLVLVVAMAVVCARAEAATYTLANVVQTQTPQASVPAFSISVTDAAVARGSFNFAADYGPLQSKGDTSDLIAFRFGSETIVSDGTGALFYHLSVTLGFAADMSVSTANIKYQALSPELTLTGSGNVLTGLYQPFDGSGCQTIFDCRILSARLVRTDTLASVPEPASILLLSSLLGFFGYGRISSAGALDGRLHAAVTSRICTVFRSAPANAS